MAVLCVRNGTRMAICTWKRGLFSISTIQMVVLSLRDGIRMVLLAGKMALLGFGTTKMVVSGMSSGILMAMRLKTVCLEFGNWRNYE
jgi:hypothetical protein